jgi:hypothetical protein
MKVKIYQFHSSSSSWCGGGDGFDINVGLESGVMTLPTGISQLSSSSSRDKGDFGVLSFCDHEAGGIVAGGDRADTIVCDTSDSRTDAFF